MASITERLKRLEKEFQESGKFLNEIDEEIDSRKNLSDDDVEIDNRKFFLDFSKTNNVRKSEDKSG